MRFKTVGNKVDITAIVVRNAEATVAIPIGSPVVYHIAATNPGLDVVLPGTEVTMATAGIMGVALGNIANAQYGEAQVFGFCNNVLLGSTRAASTDSWSTRSAAAGVILNVDTVNNVFITSGGTQAVSGFVPFAVLGASYTVTGSASATSDTRTSATFLGKGFLRMM